MLAKHYGRHWGFRIEKAAPCHQEASQVGGKRELIQREISKCKPRTVRDPVTLMGMTILKSQTCATYNMGKPQHYAKFKKPVAKDHTFYDSIYRKVD